jgi:thioredoxin 1
MANFSATINGDTPVLVDFYDDTSYPCQTMSRILQELKSRVGDRVKILKVNTGRNPQATRAYRVKNVPALILFKKGRIQWRWSGVVLPDELLRVLASSEQQTMTHENH